MPRVKWQVSTAPDCPPQPPCVTVCAVVRIPADRSTQPCVAQCHLVLRNLAPWREPSMSTLWSVPAAVWHLPHQLVVAVLCCAAVHHGQPQQPRQPAPCRAAIAAAGRCDYCWSHARSTHSALHGGVLCCRCTRETNVVGKTHGHGNRCLGKLQQRRCL